MHTPGPWHRNIKPATRYPTIFAGRNTHVAQVVSQGIGASEVEANCNLIAAAPDLLAALNAMLTHMGMDEDEWNKPTFDQARAAIAKAQG
jgi:hypothetical protein